MIWAYIITLEYEVFRFLMATAIWFITWVLSFEWLDLILTPVRTIADSVTSITDQFALTPLMLTVAGLSVAIWIIRGRFSTGIYELLMSCVIAAAAVGVLSNPVDRVLGDDGLVLSARNVGLEVASGSRTVVIPAETRRPRSTRSNRNSSIRSSANQRN